MRIDELRLFLEKEYGIVSQDDLDKAIKSMKKVCIGAMAPATAEK